eukprot:36703-Eustigmatos_ZCMA.PRE.1
MRPAGPEHYHPKCTFTTRECPAQRVRDDIFAAPGPPLLDRAHMVMMVIWYVSVFIPLCSVELRPSFLHVL